jgi:hypothetical protein
MRRAASFSSATLPNNSTLAGQHRGLLLQHVQLQQAHGCGRNLLGDQGVFLRVGRGYSSSSVFFILASRE